MFTSPESPVPLFKACQDTLACDAFTHFDGGTSKRCRAIALQVGEKCEPTNNRCSDGNFCLLDPFGEFTCRGDALWSGNRGFHPREVLQHNFEHNTVLLAAGIVMLCMWVVAVVVLANYVLSRRKGTVIPNLFDGMQMEPEF